MSNLSTRKVNSAVGSKNGFDLSFNHLTTLNFGEIIPLANWDCIAGDNFTVKYGMFSRCAPLVLPTFGDIKLETVAMFVPYYQIAEDFDAFIAGKKVYKGNTVAPRTIKASTIMDFLASQFMSTTASAITDPYDFYWSTSSGSEILKHRVFTPEGKYVYKVLRSLGYQLPQKLGLSPSADVVFNALPLLAFFKAYNDYMTNSVTYDQSLITQFLKSVADGSIKEITQAHLESFFQNVYLLYKADYFTTAWATPNAPVKGISGSDKVANMLNIGFDAVEYDHEANPVPGLASSSNISQNDLDVLRAFDSWTRRNSYSNSRTLEQIYSRYGLKVRDFSVEYADVISSHSERLSIGDVTATAQSDGAELGSYAGKGIATGADGFSYRCEDFGQLIVLGYISVKPMYADGVDRQVLKTDALDFYQPEYDAIGVNAISNMEVANDCTLNGSDIVDPHGVFGYTERYNEYRTGKDKVTGDMCLSRYVDADRWHLNRDLSELLKEPTKFGAQQNAFLQFDGQQYNKIFSITDDAEDKFYLTFNFDVKAIRPIMSVDATARLGVGNTTVHKNGNLIA